VFGIMQQAGALKGDLPYEPARFVDSSYLDDSRR
jgi:hypothetical protein